VALAAALAAALAVPGRLRRAAVKAALDEA
jgi:hypothetical protein